MNRAESSSGRVSVTAMVVALCRSIASDHPPEAPAVVDRCTVKLLPRPLALLSAFGRALNRSAAGQSLVQLLSCGLVRHMALRSAAIDEALRAAVAAGVRQVAIVGAGLDARAYRMPELSDAVVFEIDQPATVAHKRVRAACLEPVAREVRFAAVRLGCDRLDKALADVGHDQVAPTFWICEGLTMYLEPSDARALFGQMAEISAAGSRIAVTYVTPEGLPHNRLGREIMLRSLDALGEPFLGVVSREAMAEALSSAGFGLLSDENENAWIQRFAMPSKGPTFPSWEWLAVATRRC